LPEPLSVELFPSIYLRAALIALWAVLLFAVWRSALPGVLQGALGLAITSYIVRVLRRHTGLGGRADCSALMWDGAGWQWLCGRERRPVVLLRSTVWPGFLLLNFRCARTGKACVLLLLPDSAATNSLRRLRVYLRHLPVFAS